MSTRLRIGLLTPSLSRKGGGVFEAVLLQTEVIRQLGHHPVLFGLDDSYADADAARLKGAERHLLSSRGPPSLGYAPDLPFALRTTELDILHLHGIWMYPSMAGAEWSREVGKPYVISPHGMLDPWILERGKLKKWLARLAYEARNWRAASVFHALTENEEQDIRAATGPKLSNMAIKVIPNAAPVAAARRDASGDDLVYLGRIHPKKNVETLVAAFATTTFSNSPTSLVLAGWGDQSDVNRLQEQIRELERPNIRFIGPVFNDAKWELLRAAKFVILPSHSEGLPMTILEAWAQGTPTLMSRECHLGIGFHSGAALDCGVTHGEIADTLREAASLDFPSWVEMSSAALHLAKGPFSLVNVLSSWQDLYLRLHQREPL